jgi:hypothetical protein
VSLDPDGRDGPPLSVGTDPEVGVDLVVGDDFAAKDVAEEEVVVHRLRDDLGDGEGGEEEEGVVFRLSSLRDARGSTHKA